jgi:hypothetical protein
VIGDLSSAKSQNQERRLNILKNRLLTHIFILLLFPTLAAAQTISNREFKKANSPVFVVDGFVNFFAADTHQASSFENNNLPDGLSKNNLSAKSFVGNDTQIFLKAGVKTDNNVKYGAVAKVEFNANSERFNEKPNLDQAHLFSESDFGKFEIGNYLAVNQKMKVGPARFARGAGGINGKYLEYVNLPMLADSSQSSSAACSGNATSAACSNIKLPRFILLAQSPIGHGGGAKGFHSRSGDNNYSANASSYGAFNRSNFRSIKDDSFEGMEDATKLTYYSPRISGAKFGISYTPRSSNNGFTQTTVYDSNQSRMENIISVGANYSHDFDNLNLALSATGEKAQVKNSKSTYRIERYDLLSYDFGISLSYFGFDVGASYGSWGSSLRAKNGVYSCDYNSSQNISDQNCTSGGRKFTDPSYYTLGIAYKFGPIGASLTSLKSSYEKNDYQSLSLGLDYKLQRDLMPYFEITKFSFKSNQPLAADIANQGSVVSGRRQVRDSHGYVFLTGILYSF